MEQSPDGKIGPAKVFFVDDHPIVIEGLAKIINREEGLTVSGWAVSPAEALNKMMRERPDVVVTDLSFPEGSGLDLVKELHARFPNLPVLVLSVRDEALYAERALRAGAKGYVMKDEAGERIREAVRAVLDGDVYLSRDMSREMLQKYVDTSGNRSGSPAERLSDRELQVFELTGQGFGTTAIAKALYLSPKTIETYQSKIKEKLGIQDATELRQRAIRWVQSQGLV